MSSVVIPNNIHEALKSSKKESIGYFSQKLKEKLCIRSDDRHLSHVMQYFEL